MRSVCSYDLEVEPGSNMIQDIGAVYDNGKFFRGKSVHDFKNFSSTADFMVGHNLFKHDLPHLQKKLGDPSFGIHNTIDTLLLSPLLFPSRPYHRLLKDEKLQVDELNNPVTDSKKALELFNEEGSAFLKLPENLKQVYFNLLHSQKEFTCFFEYLDYRNELPAAPLAQLIRQSFNERICSHCDIDTLIKNSPVSLAYALALINATDKYSITPPWVRRNFKDVDVVLRKLRGKPCIEGCGYCNKALDPHAGLQHHFGFSEFRKYDNEPLQEDAVRAAIHGESLLAIFPTGGGKSITFQLPALMDGENTKSLTVIISPLQSLMKDQVDNLNNRGIVEAVTINGMLDPITRAEAIERVQDGRAHLLYISPESLRSISIERLLLGRKISRFVIDEAHCFSSWGQDFRVDYLYIGDFIRKLQETKGLDEKIPVSCFTATAKQKVIEDIRQYFQDKLGLDLKVFRSDASRTNLHYQVFEQEDEDQKYERMRELVEQKQVPTIIYVSRTQRAIKLAGKLTEDGYPARAFHGKMENEEKVRNQDDFIRGDVNIIVATSAFGMGVDKDNVGMVIHYDISDSLENYVQEAGRAGRREDLKADCYVLFNEEDLNKHFILLNQTKLDIKEINQVWRAIKELTKTRETVSNSALEIARIAGWDENVKEIETRVKTAIAALEDAGYIERGHNMPRIFADSILSKTAQDAFDKIDASTIIPKDLKQNAKRVIQKLISSRSRSRLKDDEAEARVDYLAEQLSLRKHEAIEIIQKLREERILADAKDLTAFIKRAENVKNSIALVSRYKQLEDFFLSILTEEEKDYNIKDLCEQATEAGCEKVSLQTINTLLNFWKIKAWIDRRNLDGSKHHVRIVLKVPAKEMKEKMELRQQVARIITEYLFKRASEENSQAEEVLVEFSVQELMDHVANAGGMFSIKAKAEDIEDSLFYLSRIEAIKIEGGFMVVYNRLTINRIEKNNLIRYKEEDYKKLKEFYQNKVQQIHIVGEYAKKMVENYKDALQFVDDYFKLNYTSFLQKYFRGSRQDDIKRNMTPAKFRQLFGKLSPPQLEIIRDSASQFILVAAGPGSGKTRVLVHKLASLILTEDIKYEQLLMLTFSRAAASEFKKRLLDLIGKAAHFVEIKTFHSYCFDLLDRKGNLDDTDKIVSRATESIRKKEVETSRITKTVLVIDEAQDMNQDEFGLVEALMNQNEEMRVIIVGDDDQNIFQFRGADSAYMAGITSLENSRTYELVDNYRSRANLVSFSNQWVERLSNRIKETPIHPVDGSDGLITVIEHNQPNLVVPLVESICNTDLAGTTCVLTNTNDEAASICGLLNNRGYNARLIQSSDGFVLFNLQELRWFYDKVDELTQLAIISEEDWELALRQLQEEFRASNKLDWCLALLKNFEAIYPERKYRSDLKDFLIQSKFEDAINISSETIYVSTIHKAKGKEFDNVFLLLNNMNVREEDKKRQVYVALTRAKYRLHIHYNGNYFAGINCNDLTYRRDPDQYPPPSQLSFMLSHKQVYLGYFEYVQDRLNGIRSGDKLKFIDGGLETADGKQILKYSKSFTQQLEKYNLSYKPLEAKVNFVVYWKGEDAVEEVRVVLPELRMGKK